MALSRPLSPSAFFRVWVTVWVNTAWPSLSGISRTRLTGHSWLLISLHTLCLKEMLELPHEDIDAEGMAVHICRARYPHPTRNQQEAKETKTTVSAHTIDLSVLVLPHIASISTDGYSFNGDSPLSKI